MYPIRPYERVKLEGSRHTYETISYPFRQENGTVGVRVRLPEDPYNPFEVQASLVRKVA